MKTYTLTWRAGSPSYNRLKRCCFCCGSFYWTRHSEDAIHNYCHLVTEVFYEDFRQSRLIKCGRLVARQATYQGM